MQSSDTCRYSSVTLCDTLLMVQLWCCKTSHAHSRVSCRTLCAGPCIGCSLVLVCGPTRTLRLPLTQQLHQVGTQPPQIVLQCVGSADPDNSRQPVNHDRSMCIQAKDRAYLFLQSQSTLFAVFFHTYCMRPCQLGTKLSYALILDIE